MAGGVIATGSKGEDYQGKLTLRVFITCIVAATGGLIFGYDLGISGGVTSMDPFLKKFFPSVYEKQSKIRPSDDQYCKYDSQILTLFTSSLYLAALFASVVASTITRSLGRRITMLGGGILFLVGALFNAFAQSLWMLILGRLLLGFGIGFANQSVPIYVSEVSPHKYRGALNMLFQLTVTIGILVANVLNYFFAKIEGGYGWRLSLGGAAVPAIIIIIGSLFLPDTPNSMIERGRLDEAKVLLKQIRGVPDVDKEFNDIVAACEASEKVKHPWRTLLKRQYRPNLVFAFFIPFFQQLTGNNVIVFYAPILFKTIGFGASASLMSSMITGFVNFIATFVSIFTVDKCGRRPLFLQGGMQMIICDVIVTVLIALKFGTTGDPGILPRWYAIILVVFICIFVAGFAWSWGPLTWLVPNEISPLEIRSAAQSLTVSVNMICTFVIAQLFTTMLCHMKFGFFIFFACFLCIMSVFIYKLLPETKGVPIEDMTGVWQKHPHWSKFVEPPSATKPVDC